MVSDALLGALVGGALTALGSFAVYYFGEWRNRRIQLKALLVEIQHNISVSQKELEEKLPWELRHAYHTLSYTSAKDAGAISSLPIELREKVLDIYDIIFALHRDEMGNAAAKKERIQYVRDLNIGLRDLCTLLEKHLDP
jgi:hypothetical protein